MAIKIGMNGKLYRNTGTYAVPVWNEIPGVSDVAANVSVDNVDVTTRANNGWKAFLTTLKDGELTFSMPYDQTDQDMIAIRNAFFRGTTVEMAVLDAAITAAGAGGLRASMVITNFERAEPLADKMMVNVTAKPTPATNAPYWYESVACASGESTTSAGAKVYLITSTGLYTFVSSGNVFAGVSVADAQLRDSGASGWEDASRYSRAAVELGRAAVESCALLRDSAGWQSWVMLALEAAESLAAFFGGADDAGAEAAPAVPPSELLHAIQLLEVEEAGAR
jgi:hypothetical protein